MWKSLSGEPVADLAEAVRALAGEEDRVIHVGTDSKQRGEETEFVTAVVVLDPGQGGRVFYRRQTRPRMQALVQRLLEEVQQSIEVAESLDGSIPQSIVLHVDANRGREHRSGAYSRMLAGLAMGYGYEVLRKPEAWCATSVADHLVRGKKTSAA